MRPYLRALGLAGAQAILLSGVGAATGGLVVATLGEAEGGLPLAGAVALTAVGVGLLALGLWLSGLVARFVSGLLALVYGGVCILSGLVALPVAFALRQFDAAAFDPARAAAWTGASALVALLVGGTLVIVGWRWIARPRERLRGVLRATAVGYGTLLFLLAAALTIAVALTTRDTESERVGGRAVAVGVLAVMLVAGTLLVYHGVSAITGTPSNRAWSAHPARAVAVWLAAILTGQVLADSRWVDHTLLPPLHALAAAGGGVTVLAVALAPARWGRRAEGMPTWRVVGVGWAWGASVATLFAGYLNAVSDGVISIAALARAGAFAGVADAEEFGAVLANANEYLTANELLAATLLLFSVAPPLVEESLKAVGVRLLHPAAVSRYTAFVVGVASGCGFGTVEAVLYGAQALEGSPETWWSLMLLRGGATTMHALATGVFGLGIWEAAHGRRRRLVVYAAAAMLLHAAWNGMSVIVMADTLPIIDALSLDTAAAALSALLGGWSLVNVAVLALVARLLARDTDTSDADSPAADWPPAVAITPPDGGAQPWTPAHTPGWLGE